MIPFIEARREGVRLAFFIRLSLLHQRDDWTEGSTTRNGASVSNAKHHTRIETIPCCIRMLDKIRVYHHGAEIWLPLITRWRLRTTVRLFLAERAAECWEMP